MTGIGGLGVSGESEATLRSLFATAVSNAPCIVLIDEVHITDVFTRVKTSGFRSMLYVHDEKQQLERWNGGLLVRCRSRWMRCGRLVLW